MIAYLLIGFMLGLCVMFIIADRAISKLHQRWFEIVEFWRSEQVKAKREAIAAKLQIIQERQDDIRASEWWKHTED